MQPVLWTFFVLAWTCVYCYENLSRRSTSIISMSSTYNSYTASQANDGNLNITFTYCSHTDLNQTRAWLQVDLGKPYSISSVMIYYRNDGNQWMQYRFRQFYLDVSDISVTHSTTTQRTRCYTDNTNAPNLPPNIIDIRCKQTARYVIVETTYDAPEDDPTTGPVLEICEIEVYVCESTRYGPTCSLECADSCVNSTCNNYTGSCMYGCQEGFYGDHCDRDFKPRQDSCTENLSILIGVCVVLCISVVVNGCTITWILRHNWCKQRDVTRQKTTGDSHSNDFVLQQGIYETTEDNAGYQELGQVSEPSHYDQLRT